MFLIWKDFTTLPRPLLTFYWWFMNSLCLGFGCEICCRKHPHGSGSSNDSTWNSSFQQTNGHKSHKLHVLQWKLIVSSRFCINEIVTQCNWQWLFWCQKFNFQWQPSVEKDGCTACTGSFSLYAYATFLKDLKSRWHCRNSKSSIEGM